MRNFDLLFLFPGNEAVETAAKAALTRHYAHLDRILAAQLWFDGAAFGISDAYLFTVTGWAPLVKVDLAAFAHVVAWQARVAARPAVQAALAIKRA